MNKKICYSSIRGISLEDKEERMLNLKNYKYVSVDKSVINNYFLNNIWEKMVCILPMWIAPNVLTVTGSLFILYACLLNIYYDYELLGNAPAFIYYNNAICLLIYMTFDAIDGKQARRTNSSSPLGQLFDHGIDSIVATLSTIMFTSAMGIGCSFESFMLLFCFKCIFYFVSFEEFFTHSFVLGRFSGPTESILLGVFVFMISAIFKPSCWSIFIKKQMYVQCSILSFIGFIFIILKFITCIISSVKNMKTGSKLSMFINAIIPIVFYICFYIYFRQISSMLEYYVLFLTEIFNFSIVLLEMSYAHLTKSEIPISWPSIGLFVACVYLKYKDIYLYCIFLISFLSYCLIVLGIINEICDFLDICCFTIQTNSIKNKKN